jgi:hypothetical protein
MYRRDKQDSMGKQEIWQEVSRYEYNSIEWVGPAYQRRGEMLTHHYPSEVKIAFIIIKKEII